MFNKEAKVHDTKLFVGRTQDGQWQLTVYANSVDAQNAKSSNAMVLPFPVPNGTSTDSVKEPHKVSSNSDILRVLDFSNHKTFFNECEACFPQPRSRQTESKNSAPSPNSKLEVVQIGGYNISIARTLDFIQHIDKDVFSVADNLYRILQKNYDQGFGFLICSFDTSKKISSKDTAPLAYVHRMGEEFFVPTRHEHGHDEELPHWDHVLYMWNAKHGLNNTATNNVSALNMARLNKKLPAPLESCKMMNKVTIVGKRKNEDLVISKV